MFRSLAVPTANDTAAVQTSVEDRGGQVTPITRSHLIEDSRWLSNFNESIIGEGAGSVS